MMDVEPDRPADWWQASDFKWYPPEQHPERTRSVLPTAITPSVVHQTPPAKRAIEYRSWWRRAIHPQ